MLPAHDISRVTTAQTLHAAARLGPSRRVAGELPRDAVPAYRHGRSRPLLGRGHGGRARLVRRDGGAGAGRVLAHVPPAARRPAHARHHVCADDRGPAHVLYRGSVRHFGVTFVAFLCGLWLVRAAGQRIAWPAYVLLAMSAVAGVRATVGSWQRPFSQARATADYLHANHLDARPDRRLSHRNHHRRNRTARTPAVPGGVRHHGHVLRSTAAPARTTRRRCCRTGS